MAPKASVTKAQQPEPQHSTPQDIGEADGEGEKMRDPAADAPPRPNPNRAVHPKMPPETIYLTTLSVAKIEPNQFLY